MPGRITMSIQPPSPSKAFKITNPSQKLSAINFSQREVQLAAIREILEFVASKEGDTVC